MEILKTGRRRAGVYAFAGLAALGLIETGEGLEAKAEQSQMELDASYNQPEESNLDGELNDVSHELSVNVHGTAADMFDAAGTWLGVVFTSAAGFDLGRSARQRTMEPLPASNTTEWIPPQPLDVTP